MSNWILLFIIIFCLLGGLGIMLWVIGELSIWTCVFICIVIIGIIIYFSLRSNHVDLAEYSLESKL